MIKPALIRLVLAAAITPLPAVAVNLYWDVNGNAPGASTAPAGTWSTGALDWNTSADGIGNATTLVPWTDGDIAVFAAGTDATTPYTVTIASGARTPSGVIVEEGFVNLVGPGTIAIGGNHIVINPGATLGVDITPLGRFSTTAGSGAVSSEPVRNDMHGMRHDASGTMTR